MREYTIKFVCDAGCGEHRIYADYDCPVSEEAATKDLIEKEGWTVKHGCFICPGCTKVQKAHYG